MVQSTFGMSIKLKLLRNFLVWMKHHVGWEFFVITRIISLILLSNSERRVVVCGEDGGVNLYNWDDPECASSVDYSVDNNL